MKIQSPFRTAFLATLGVGLGLLLISSVQSLSSILLYVGTALFLALGLEPMVSWLVRHRLPRWSAVLVTILILLAVFAGVMLMILPIIIDQISQFVAAVTRIFQNPSWPDELKDWLTSVFPTLRVDDIFAYIEEWLAGLDFASIGGSIGGSVIVLGASIAAGLFGAFIVLILTIYFTASIPSLKKAVYQVVPASRRSRFVDLSEQITDSVGYYVIGQVTLGLINGTLSAIFLSIIGAPFPAVLAVVALLFSLIPLVGTLTGSTIIVLACLIPGLGSPTTALIAAIYYLIYMQVEAYVISPRIMSRAVRIPGAVVVVAALAGGALLGLLGALIAIPVAASIMLIYREVLIPRQNDR
ncbi:AI-2E family transporter [Microbacterium sediminicola]|uniref:AI-2E family transporter n=1 Tax=Microbacterium sediminicola TaxID=415210 RepID=A0ABP4TQN2_9MICO